MTTPIWYTKKGKTLETVKRSVFARRGRDKLRSTEDFYGGKTIPYV